MFYICCSKNGPKTVPRRPQDGPKMAPRWTSFLKPSWNRFLTKFWPHLGTIFWSFLGSILASTSAATLFDVSRGCMAKRMHADLSSDPLETDLGATWPPSKAPGPWEFSMKLKMRLSPLRAVFKTTLERFWDTRMDQTSKNRCNIGSNRNNSVHLI